MKDKITVGQIINTHGIKGELKVYPLTDDIKRFKKLKYVLLDGEEKKVLWCKLQNDKAILKLEGIDTMDAAEKLKTKYLQVKREDAVKLPEGGYFVVDIIGCKVIDTKGEEVGEVKEVIFTGSNDVYWVKGKKDIMVPVIDSVVKEIDVENSKIIIEPVEVWNYED